MIYTQLAPALRRKNCSHDPTAVGHRRELGGYHSTQRVIPSDSDPLLYANVSKTITRDDRHLSHNNAPDDENADDIGPARRARDRLAVRRDDNDHQLDPV